MFDFGINPFVEGKFRAVSNDRLPHRISHKNHETLHYNEEKILISMFYSILQYEH